MVYGSARVCKGINLRGREAYATVPNKTKHITSPSFFLLLQVLSVLLIQQTKMLYIDEERGQSQAIGGWYQPQPVLCEGIAKSKVVEKKKKTRFSFTPNGDDDGDNTDVEGGEEEEEGEESTPPTPVDLSGKRILVRDGLTNGMELLQKRKGKRYPKLVKNTGPHYPCNVLPSTFIEAIARRTRYADSCPWISKHR